MHNSKKIVCGVVALAVAGATWAADPGGLPGLVKAKFTGSAFNDTGDVSANALGYAIYPEEMYASTCPEKTTYAWAGYMKMTGGVTYNFKGRYDDYVTVKIADTWVISRGGEVQERTGSYTPPATDWYPVEFRVGNNGGAGGCTSADVYGILWNTSEDATWRKVQELNGGQNFKTGRNDLKLCMSKTTPVIVSSKMRTGDPTIMDVEYIVLSKHDTVHVRALAFENGERSFWKVVRATTFVKDPDGNETACNIGSNITANVTHKLAWKVSADWQIDLSKVKFEVICSDQAQLPLKLQTIPATAKNPAITVTYNTQSDTDLYNAILWFYAAEHPDFVKNDNGCLNVKGACWVNRAQLNRSWDMLKYFYEMLGYKPLYGGSLLNYVRGATRKDLWNNSGVQNCWIQTNGVPSQLYIGEKAFCVIDVSGGPDAARYPISYLDTEPVNGWGDEYKTTKILLRRCEAGKYMFRESKEVTLTKAFYMGVFTVTQKQYLQVMGTNPTESEHQGDMRPVEISWNAIRGDSATYNWPTVRMVDPNTFVGKIQSKTGLKFDLPTDVQWEYASRAGTLSNYNNGGDGNEDMHLTGHSGYEMAGKDTVAVGLYVPNFWGLYDMHGNAGQWCLDYCDDYNSDPAIDYEGAESGSTRVIRGYKYYVLSSFLRYGDAPSSYRCNYFRYDDSLHFYTYFGFRLCWTLAE